MNKTTIPAWYLLENYQDAIKLNIKGWYKNLKIRQQLLQAVIFCTNPKYDNEESNVELVRSEYEQYAKIIRNEPIVGAITSAVIADFLNEAPENLSPNNRLNNPSGILTFTPEEAIPHCAYLADIEDNIERTVIHINPDIPTSTLLASIKKHISSIRKSKKPRTILPRLERYECNKWIQLGALQFIDLLTFSIEKSSRLTNQQYADAIFPLEYPGTAETVRKSTRKLALSLLNDETLDNLLSLA